MPVDKKDAAELVDTIRTALKDTEAEPGIPHRGDLVLKLRKCLSKAEEIANGREGN